MTMLLSHGFHLNCVWRLLVMKFVRGQKPKSRGLYDCCRKIALINRLGRVLSAMACFRKSSYGFCRESGPGVGSGDEWDVNSLGGC